MPKKMWVLSLLTVVLVTSFATLNLSAQNPVTGEWTASLSKDKSKLNLELVRTEKRGRIDQSFELSELGLTREQIEAGGPVRFSLTREAGTVDAEGSFQNGKGSGTFRFTGSSTFLAAMKSRGFDFEKESSREMHGGLEERLLAATLLNVTTARADDLVSAGFGNLTVGDLFKATIFKIDSAYMREMKNTGFPNLGMGELVKARIFKIDAKFVREAAEMGFEKHQFEDLVKMSIFKITHAYVTEIRNEGFNNLTMEEIVKLRIFNIDADFIRKAKAEGVPLNVERLVQRRIGVDRVRTRAIVE
jgi:hypothetical protein